MEAKTSKLSKLDVMATARKKLNNITSNSSATNSSTTTTSSSIPRRVYTPTSWKENSGSGKTNHSGQAASSTASDPTQAGPKSPTGSPPSSIKNGPKTALPHTGSVSVNPTPSDHKSLTRRAVSAVKNGAKAIPPPLTPSVTVNTTNHSSTKSPTRSVASTIKNGVSTSQSGRKIPAGTTSTVRNGARGPPLASSSTITSSKTISRPKSRLAKSVVPTVQYSEPSNKETNRIQRVHSIKDKKQQDTNLKNQERGKLSKQSSVSSSHTNNSALISTTGSGMTKKAAERSKSFNLKTLRPQTTDHHKFCKKKLTLAQNHINSCLSAFDAMTCLVKYLTEELDAFSTPMLKSENKFLGKKTDILENSLAEQEEIHKNELLLISAENLKVISELEAEHRTELESSIEQLQQENSEQINLLNAKFEDDLQSVNEEHEMETTVLIENHEIENIQAANDHKSELEAVLEEYREKEAELKASHEEEIEKIKTDESYAAQYIKELHEVNRNARAEVESLKSVLELKNEEISKLRLHSAELENKVHSLYNAEDMIKRLEAKNEQFQALVERKTQSERELSSEQIKLRQSLDKESNEKKRLSMENEELQWRLQNFSASGASATSPLKAAHLFFEDSLKPSTENCSLEGDEA